MNFPPALILESPPAMAASFNNVSNDELHTWLKVQKLSVLEELIIPAVQSAARRAAEGHGHPVQQVAASSNDQLRKYDNFVP
jgi:hypothetical protein